MGQSASDGGMGLDNIKVMVERFLLQDLGEKKPVNRQTASLGKLVFDGEGSRHVAESFWTGQYQEVCEDMIISRFPGKEHIPLQLSLLL